jgi:hypothetical protein
MEPTCDLEEFALTYIQSAREILLGKPLSLGEFYSALFDKVSEKTGVSRKGCSYVHHLFHWEMFLTNRNSVSPFAMYSLNESGEINYDSFGMGSANVSLREGDEMMFDLFRRIVSKTIDLPKNGNKPKTSNYEYLEQRFNRAKTICDSEAEVVNISRRVASS